MKTEVHNGMTNGEDATDRDEKFLFLHLISHDIHFIPDILCMRRRSVVRNFWRQAAVCFLLKAVICCLRFFFTKKDFLCWHAALIHSWRDPWQEFTLPQCVASAALCVPTRTSSLGSVLTWYSLPSGLGPRPDVTHDQNISSLALRPLSKTLSPQHSGHARKHATTRLLFGVRMGWCVCIPGFRGLALAEQSSDQCRSIAGKTDFAVCVHVWGIGAITL